VGIVVKILKCFRRAYRINGDDDVKYAIAAGSEGAAKAQRERWSSAPTRSTEKWRENGEPVENIGIGA